MVEEKIICPLGSECKKIVGNRLERCAWLVTMKGVDASGQEHDEEKCAIAWQPILSVEMSSTNRGQTAAIESLRNENDKRQREAIAVVMPKLKGVI